MRGVVHRTRRRSVRAVRGRIAARQKPGVPAYAADDRRELGSSARELRYIGAAASGNNTACTDARSECPMSDDSIHDVRERVNALATQTDAQRFRLVMARARVRRRVDRLIHRRGALLGMFVAGLVFGSLPASKPSRLRKGASSLRSSVSRLPGGLMSVVLIALRVQSAFQRLARAARPAETPLTTPVVPRTRESH